MAYCAPLSLSCARFMVKHTFPSSFPSQWQQTRFGGSAAGLHFRPRKAIRVPKSGIHRSFSSERKDPPRSVKVIGTRRGELGVVTVDTWDEYVLNSDIPVLVEFWAAWCGPCRMVHREIEEVAKEYAGRINCYLLKADDDMEVAEKYDIKVVPVVVLFKNGEKRETVTGTMPYHVYVAAIEKTLAS